MKKYLMTGVAALAICAAFTSCSKNEELYNPEQIKQNEIAQVYENYNRAFIATFGQPAANQDWGFGSTAKTREADPRGNMWAAEGWNVPPVITAEQKNLVRQYFQQNPNPQYNDPGWKDFWIQQVYEGGTNTQGSLSAESYLSANSSTVIGGEHMDHLVAVDKNGKQDHIYDFNNADNNDWEGRMLMRNSSTYSFGYITSEASVYHVDKTGLVHWSVIQKWAYDNGLDPTNKVLDDGWNRSYMGFDYEQLDEKDVYAKNGDGSIKTATYAGPGNPQYIWDGNTVTKVFDQVNWQNVPIAGYEHMKYNNKEVPLVIMNLNQFSGSQITVDESNLKITKPYNGEDVLCLNMKYIVDNLLSQGYLPQDNGTNKDWVRVFPCADGYYSDWIVTLTEAKQEKPEWDVRIMAEDLNATAVNYIAGEEKDSDWDFNDVVFDIKFDKDGTGGTIRLVAAGGVLPLTVDGHEVHHEFDNQYPANPANDYLYPMINTGAGPNLPYVTFRVADADKANNGKGIKIRVRRQLSDGNTEWFDLKANMGQPAAKFAVPTTVDYCSERLHITRKYTNFGAWVVGDLYVWY